jgi:hypothetical protein
VTRWGLLLLFAFLALGLSSLETRRAMTYGVWAAALVILFVSVKAHAL